MKTTWRVTKTTSTEGATIAELRSVQWFKKNPAYDPDAPDDAYVDEFIDCDPGDEDGEFIDSFGSMTIDVTDGLELRAGDNVFVTIDAVEREWA